VEIVQDLDVLHKVSEAITEDEVVADVVAQLLQSLPENALGLSAPQIGIHKRVFIANLLSGPHIFVNPEITWRSSDQVPSQEGCLSLPGITWCVSRHRQVEISWTNLLHEKMQMRLKDLDSFIVQHEMDHLDGIVLTDKHQVPTDAEKAQNRLTERAQKLHQSRQKKVSTSISQPKRFSPKKLAKLKRQEKNHNRTLKKREKIRVETEERLRAEQEGLFDS
jgi:peptide deformylase